jgi:hypothetical protein
LDRNEALRRYTLGSAWFTSEEDKKGSIETGKLADLAVLSADYFSVPEQQIKSIESVLTVVGGKVVYGAEEFVRLGPPPLPFSPGWSPVATYGGYHGTQATQPVATQQFARAGLLHRLLDDLAKKSRRLAAAREPIGLACECYVF